MSVQGFVFGLCQILLTWKCSCSSVYSLLLDNYYQSQSHHSFNRLWSPLIRCSLGSGALLVCCLCCWHVFGTEAVLGFFRKKYIFLGKQGDDKWQNWYSHRWTTVSSFLPTKSTYTMMPYTCTHMMKISTDIRHVDLIQSQLSVPTKTLNGYLANGKLCLREQ